MTAIQSFRLYGPDELGRDGYPPEWHRIPQDSGPWQMGPLYAPGDGLKHIVRKLADDRCVRCQHPYADGAGEWSTCDERCTHRGPVRLIYVADDDSRVDVEHELATEANVVVGYGKTVLARWRILTVHHLDNDKANCRWWNLAALCQRCHLRVQGKVQMARVWPWEHTAWFRPYVAGFYAHTYLGEDLTRAEVDGRLDELLGLELMA